MSAKLYRFLVLAVGALLISLGGWSGAIFGGVAVIYALWDAPDGDGKRLDELENRLVAMAGQLKELEERP